MAVLALVFAFVISPRGVVFGFPGHRQIARTGERGKVLATTGLLLGVVFFLLGVLALVLGMAAAETANSPLAKSAVESQIAARYEAAAVLW